MYAYVRKTQRNAVVFGPAGYAYIYRIYRQYHCFNIVTDREGLASTILIRAVHLEKLPSWHVPKKKPDPIEKVAAGPGKLCRELKIDDSLKGVAIAPDSGLWIEATPTQESLKTAREITQTTRIGLSKGTDIPWRWYLTHSPAVSRLANP